MLSRSRALAHSRTRALAHSRTRALTLSRTRVLAHTRSYALAAQAHPAVTESSAPAVRPTPARATPMLTYGRARSTSSTMGQGQTRFPQESVIVSVRRLKVIPAQRNNPTACNDSYGSNGKNNMSGLL